MANPIITKIQVEGNDVVSFLNGTDYVRGMSQILPQSPTYISYRYDSITISQVAGDAFTFSVYTVTDVGGNSFTALTIQDPADVVQAKTIEIYRLLVTSIFKGCCECGDTEPECSIQYTYNQDAEGSELGTFAFRDDNGKIYFNNITGNNQDFSGFFPIVQDGSWVFIFSKTDPTVFAVLQLSSYADGIGLSRFDYTLLNGAGIPFVDGTEFCIDFTSVGGSLVQDWQDTLIIGSTLTQDNTVDGGGFDFVFDNNSSFTINGPGGSVEVDAAGPSLNAGSQQILVTSGYIDIITPDYGSAQEGWVLALDANGHVEYVEAGTGTISSIGLFMPPAFTVSTPNPLTANGSFTVDGAGTALEYINGLGELATLPVYTVENGLHAFGGVPGEAPPNPFLFHLGGLLIEDTTITTTNGGNEYGLGVAGLVGQNTQQPFGVSNLGNGGVATFQDYGSGARPNPSVEIIGDVDLLQPLLELNMEGNLPTVDDTMLRLRYSGNPSAAKMTIDYQFRNNNAVVANSNFIASRLSTEVVSFVDNSESSRFELQLMQGGTLANRMQMQGFGQLILNNYATGSFANATTNIDNTLEYVLAVKNDGTVWKKLVEGGGTVTSVGATGLLTTTATNPFTVSGTVTSQMNSGFLVGRYSPGLGVFQEITIGAGLDLSVAGVLTADGSVPAFNGDQGVYKDTSLATETFMLGAPTGLQGTIPFLQNRFIDVDDFRLQMEGTIGSGILALKDGTAILPLKLGIITSVTDNPTPAGVFISENFNSVEIITSGVDQVAAIISNNGTGVNSYAAEFDCINGHGIFVNSSTFNTFEINSTSASNSTIDNVIFIGKRPLSAGLQGEGTSIAMTPGNDWDNVVIPIGATLNCVVRDPGTGGRIPIPATVDFRIDTNNTGIIIQHTSFIGNGQLQLHEYGKTPANFPDPSPVWALGVDASGNVVEIDPGGGGGTYTVNNGLTENPANNFQLGGDLIQDTIVSGDGNQWRMTFDEMLRFTANANSRISLRVEELDPLSPNFGSFTLYQATNQVVTISSYNNTTTTTHSLALEAGNVSGIQGPLTSFGVTDSKLNVKTPNVTGGSAMVGQVLTLMDLVTGEAEFQDAGSGGGIPFAVASGTDTYTATVAGVTGYTDGDAYIIRFTNGNTDQSTLNISGNGAKILYKNNDGPLIGGDVWDGAEMICIYNLAIDGFSCIGSSPNSLYAYVTNVNGSTITRGQAVVAFGGTGNRMTVKLAQANNDANSAQTIGFVFSTSIADNQKGIIIIQGYFTGLSLFPTATWADGDPVYLSPTTPGAVTKVKPYAPSHLVYLGIVATASNGSAGRMYVRVQNGYELDELHNVQAQSPNLNDTIRYDTADSQWKTASVPSLSGTFSIGVTVDGSGGTITAGVKGYVRVPYACTINTWSILTGNAGAGATITFDIWRANNAIPTVANSLVGAGTKPFLTSNTSQITSAAPSGWTAVTLAANDVLAFNVEAGAAVFSWANLQLLVTKS